MITRPFPGWYFDSENPMASETSAPSHFDAVGIPSYAMSTSESLPPNQYHDVASYDLSCSEEGSADMEIPQEENDCMDSDGLDTVLYPRLPLP